MDQLSANMLENVEQNPEQQQHNDRMGIRLEKEELVRNHYEIR